MGIPSEMRDIWVKKRNSFVIASPLEDQKALNAKICTQGSLFIPTLFFFKLINLMHRLAIFGAEIEKLIGVSFMLCFEGLISCLIVD